jgi:hypothetical protein
MPYYQVTTSVVASGQQQSPVIGVQGGDLFGLVIPTVITSTATGVTLFGAVSSAGPFVKLQNPAGSGDFTLFPGAAPGGSKGYTLQDPALPFPFLIVDLGVAQTAPVSLQVVTKLRWK